MVFLWQRTSHIDIYNTFCVLTKSNHTNVSNTECILTTIVTERDHWYINYIFQPQYHSLPILRVAWHGIEQRILWLYAINTISTGPVKPLTTECAGWGRHSGVSCIGKIRKLILHVCHKWYLTPTIQDTYNLNINVFVFSFISKWIYTFVNRHGRPTDSGTIMQLSQYKCSKLLITGKRRLKDIHKRYGFIRIFIAISKIWNPVILSAKQVYRAG